MSLTADSLTFRERQSGVYTATVADPDGNAVALSKVTSLELTLEKTPGGAIVNSRDGQNVLNLNNVTYDENGLLTWKIQPADNALIDSTLAHGCFENHRATFWIKWSDGGEDFEHNWELALKIKSVGQVT